MKEQVPLLSCSLLFHITFISKSALAFYFEVLLTSIHLLIQELTKFINFCNESKAATVANKDGGQLSIVKPQVESNGAK